MNYKTKEEVQEQVQEHYDCALYKKCLISHKREFLTKIKRNKFYSLGDIKWIMDTTVEMMKEKKNKYFETHDLSVKTEVKKMFDVVVINCMEINFVNYLGQRYA